MTAMTAPKKKKAKEIIIDKSNKYFHAIYFVCQAISQDYTAREVLTLLKVEEDRIIATDGYRLHMRENNCGLKPGLYHVVKHLKSKVILKKEEIESYKYHDYEMIFPDLKVDYNVINLKEPVVSLAYTKVIRAMNDESTLNIDYFTDIYNTLHYTSDVMNVHVHTESPYKPVVIKCGEYTALLMPLRVYN